MKYSLINGNSLEVLKTLEDNSIKIKRKEPNRIPNTKCDICDKEIYRRPNLLIKNKGKFCSTACRNKKYPLKDGSNFPPPKYGKDNHFWKGGITSKKSKGNYTGVKYVRCPIEFISMSRKDGYITEHRLVMAKFLQRNLTKTEVVHHIDHNPSNNNIENLMLFKNNSEHKKYEAINKINK